jgi:hypothetical protein
MIAEQAELNLRAKAARGVNRDSIEELCQLLRGRGWVTSRQIQTLRPDWNERFIRLLARGSRARVVSGPGTPGYCLTDETDDADLEHAGRSLLSQGRDMSRSGIAYLRIFALRKKTQQVTQQPVS